MKLVTSTGDFAHYVSSVAEEIANFKDTKFRYINLEQPASEPAFFSENDEDYRRVADKWGEAAAAAGVKFVVAHAPCLNDPVFEALENRENATYRANIRALRRSIAICSILGIQRIVVHANSHESFSHEELYKYNSMFYSDLLETAEKCGVTILTENWDHHKYMLSTGKDLRNFVDYMDHPLLAVCWDTAHGNIDPLAREIGQYENIMTIGDKLKGLHISDNFGDCHHHSWPFAGIINFDSIMQGLVDTNYDGYFTFEASYTMLHSRNIPYHRKAWEHNGETVTRLLNPSIELKKQAIDLLYETGKYILESYNCFEE